MAGAGVICGLILLGGNLSTTLVCGTVSGAMAFIGGVRLRYLLLILLVGVTMAGAAIHVSPERMRRITVYRNPEEQQRGEGYQLWISQLALGSGGWTGRGFTNSRMKRFYLPESHTDFIVAIVGEELGFLGILVLVGLYLALFTGTVWTAALCSDTEGALLCVGVAL